MTEFHSEQFTVRTGYQKQKWRGCGSAKSLVYFTEFVANE